MARAMKDSGIPWIGEIPQGWEIKRMKDCFISNNRRQPNNTVLSLSYGNVIVKDMEEKKGVTPESYESYQGVHPGDVILRLTDLQNDQKSLRVGRATTKGIITSAYLCVSSRMLNDRYSAYLLHDVGDIQKLFYGLGGGVRQSMKFADLAELLFSLPPLPEQVAIADYLDRQTALIDQRLETLAEKKTVLAELRKAIIHEAVTKGSTWNAETGHVEGLTNGWVMLRIKDIANLRSGDFIAADRIEPIGVFPVYGGNGLRGYTDRFTHDGTFALIGRQGALCGNINYATGKFWATEHAVVVRHKRKTVTRWLGEMLRCMNLNQYATASAQPGLSVEVIINKFLPFPPLDEQQSIADHLDQQTAQIDAQLATLDEQTRALKELRKSIIHEAVTGKIDLSGYTPPTPEALAA